MSGKVKTEAGNSDASSAKKTRKGSKKLEFKPKELFMEKWIILKRLENTGDVARYLVCDKSLKIFGTLWIEEMEDGIATVCNSINFLHQQEMAGNSSYFLTVADSGIIDEEIVYMTTFEKNGTTLEKCIESTQKDFIPPATLGVIALDILRTFEILSTSGYSICDFNFAHWKLDADSRRIYLADPTIIVPSLDRRFTKLVATIDKKQLKKAWIGEKRFAPLSYHEEDNWHRIDELDMIEMLVFVLFEHGIDHLPWSALENVYELKKEMISGPPQRIFDKTPEYSSQLALEIVLHNMCFCLKEARFLTNGKLSRCPVGDGAYLPNGTRAGALATAVNYDSMYCDFRVLALDGRPSNLDHFREFPFCWEVELRQHEEYSSKSTIVELMRARAEVEKQRETQKVLLAKEIHFDVMMEQQKIQEQISRMDIDRFLNSAGSVKSGKTSNGKTTRNRKMVRSSLQMSVESEDSSSESSVSTNEKPVVGSVKRISRGSSCMQKESVEPAKVGTKRNVRGASLVKTESVEVVDNSTNLRRGRSDSVEKKPIVSTGNNTKKSIRGSSVEKKEPEKVVTKRNIRGASLVKTEFVEIVEPNTNPRRGRSVTVKREI